MSAIDDAWSAVARLLEDAPRNALARYPNNGSYSVREEAVRYISRLFSGGPALAIENADPAYPELNPFVGWPWMNWGLPCPDSQYFYAPVHGDFTYRMFGHRGTPHMLRALVYNQPCPWHRRAEDTVDFSSTTRVSHLESYRRPDGIYDGSLEVGPAGEVEIVLSREPQEGNWLGLPPGGGTLIFRHDFYDWENEQLAPIWIERVGADYPPPPPARAQIEEGVGRLAGYLHDYPDYFGMVASTFYTPDSSRIEFQEEFSDHNFRTEQGQPGQLYGRGNFKCGPDEAVILEVEAPDCNYWSFALYSPFLEIMDHHRRQGSLNGRQAFVDAAGIFRAVISQQDPGVANWLDCGNSDEGLIVGRYVGAMTRPVARLQVVPFDEISGRLPPETPVVTPSERSDVLRRRWLSFYRSRGFGAALPSH